MPCGKSFCKERFCMQMRRWCRSSKRTARPLSPSLTCGFTVPAWMGCLPLFCTSTSPDAAANIQRSFWRGSMDTCIPTAMPATTRCRILPAAAAGPICAGSSWRPCLLHPATPKVCSHRHRLAGITVTSCLQLKRNWLDCQPKKDRKQRLAVEKPMLRAFWCWLEELERQPLAGNLKKAVQYARKQQPYMENYLLDPRCQISNNLAENAIRPFTVGRKNWLFSDTVKGAKASA